MSSIVTQVTDKAAQAKAAARSFLTTVLAGLVSALGLLQGLDAAGVHIPVLPAWLVPSLVTAAAAVRTGLAALDSKQPLYGRGATKQAS